MTDDTQHPSIPSPVLPPDIDDFTYEQVETKEQIGTGGDANVYRAIVSQNDTEHTIAVKEPRFEGTIQQEVIEQFEKEAETWNKLDDHPNVVTVYSWGAKSLPWLGLEYMDGGTLEAHLGDLAIEEALWLAGRIAEGIQQGHRHGVAHLDLKPSNVLLRDTPDGKFPYPKVSDWGLAKLLLEHSKSVEGLSPTYAAPEQFDTEEYGKTDNITDIYQFGAVVYALCTGEPPFTGSATSVMQGILTKKPDPPSAHNTDVPDELDEIILKALSKSKDQRYESIVLIRKQIDDLFEKYIGNKESMNGDLNKSSVQPTRQNQTGSDHESPNIEQTTTSSNKAIQLPVSRRAAIGVLGISAIGIGTAGTLQSGILTQLGSTGPNSTSTGEQAQDTEKEDVSLESIISTQWKIDKEMFELRSGDIDDELYGAPGSDTIAKINSRDGNTQWENTPSSNIEGSNAIRDLAVGEDHIFSLGGAVPENNIATRLYALNSTTGEEEWFFQGEHNRWRFPGHLTVSDDYVYFVESNMENTQSILRCFRHDSQTPVWKKEYSDNRGISNIEILNNSLLILGNVIELLNPQTGESVNTVTGSGYGQISEVETAENAIYIYDGSIKKTNLNFDIEWAYDTQNRVTSSPKLGSNSENSTHQVVFPTKSLIKCLDGDTGESVWQHQIYGEINEYGTGGLSIINGTVWAFDDVGYLYVLGLKTGNVYFQEQLNRDHGGSSLLSGDDSLFLSFSGNFDSSIFDNQSDSQEITTAISVNQ